MLITAAFIFGAVILLGLFLLSYVLQSKDTPKAIAFIHGSLASVGLILLIIYAYFNPSGLLIASIVLFILAACGGALLIYKDITGQGVPKVLALGHGFLALTAFIILLLSFFVS